MSATRSRHSAAGSPPDADARGALAREVEEVTAAAKASWEVVQPIAAREGEILAPEAVQAYGYGGLRWFVGVHYIQGTDDGRARCVRLRLGDGDGGKVWRRAVRR